MTRNTASRHPRELSLWYSIHLDDYRAKYSDISSQQINSNKLRELAGSVNLFSVNLQDRPISDYCVTPKN